MSKMQEALMAKKLPTPHPDRVIALSGAFDVLHPGHTRMIRSALNFGKVVIILNSDEWVQRNKGALVMPWNDRCEVLLSVYGVGDVVPVEDSDNTVCEALERIQPHIFGNGGMRIKKNTPESALCQRLGVVCVWGLGGGEHDAYSINVLNRVFSAQRPEHLKKAK